MLLSLLLWNMADFSLSLADRLCEALQKQVIKTVFPYAAFKTTEQTDREEYAETFFICPPYISFAVLNAGYEQRPEDAYFHELLLAYQSNQTEDILEAMAEENERAKEAGEDRDAENAREREKDGEEGENGSIEEGGSQEQSSKEHGEEQNTQTEAAANSQEEGTGEDAEAMGHELTTEGFVKVKEKQQTYNWDQYEDFNVFLQEFYAVDSTTKADAKLLKPQEMLSKNLTIEKNKEGYDILVFHTHSQEDFVNSIEGDKSTTIVGVGDYLTQILENEYGYRVLHHTGEYDVEYRDKAYSKALPAIEEVLAQHPEIQVVLDIHRDEVAEGTKLVTELQGKPTAKFMFFNGLSYTNQTGAISYLENINLADNLAFSFQMQVVCNEYFPGLTRRIYLKGYRYNMHLKDKYLLVEMGAQTNTVEEVKNACNPLAQALDKVLSGMVY